MAALKYLLILSLGFCWMQLACGQSPTTSIFTESDEPEDEDIGDFDETEMKSKAKEKLLEYMDNENVQETITTFRGAVNTLLKTETSSMAIIRLMGILEKAMTAPQSLKTVQKIQAMIRDMLKKPDNVKKFLENIVQWFRDPLSLSNIEAKDKLLQKCIGLAKETKCIDTLAKGIRKLKHQNAPELINKMYENFYLLINYKTDLKWQDFLMSDKSKATKTLSKVTSGSKSLVGRTLSTTKFTNSPT